VLFSRVIYSLFQFISLNLSHRESRSENNIKKTPGRTEGSVLTIITWLNYFKETGVERTQFQLYNTLDFSEQY